MHIGWKIPIWKNHPIKMGRSSEDDGEIVEIWKNSPIADECVGKDWVNIWNDKKTPNAGENVIVMRCHSHYAALHAHVALARYTSSPKISRLWASSHGWFRPACAPLVETRKFKFRGMIYEKNDDYNNRYYCVFSKWLTCMVHRNMVWSDWIW